MKKLFISISLVISCFFFFNTCNVDAAVNFTLDYDINEHFNYFYEQKENTPFYQFLISQGYSFFTDFLKSFKNDFSYVYILYTSDIPSDTLSDIPVDAKYAVVLTSYGSYRLYYNASKFRVDVSRTGLGASNDMRIIFFDENAHVISSTYISKVGARLFSFITEDVTYVLSFLYYGYDFSYASDSNSKPDVRLTRLKVNNIYYNIKDLNTRNNFLNFWSNLGNIFFNDSNMKNLNDIGLSFFLNNYYITSSKDGLSLYNILNYNSLASLNVPDNYSSQSFSYDSRYLLVPNNLSCSLSESLLYFSTSDINSINFVNYSYLTDNISFKDINGFSFKLKKPNSIEALSLNNFISSDSKITDYIYLIYSDDNFSANTIYYNPECYSVYSAVSNVEINFKNINSGNDVTLSPGELQLIINSSNEFQDSLSSSTSDYTNLDIASIISGAWNGAKTFISASYYIVSMTSTLFVLLPSSVSSLILCVFTLGMLIILWKVFRS